MKEHRGLSADKPVECHTQVIGLGVAGLGLAMAADKQGRLDELLNKGLTFIDKRAPDQWHSLQYDIASNSGAADFLEGIRRDGMAAELLASPLGEKILASQDGLINLQVVASFFEQLARQLADEVSGYSQSGIIHGQTVSELRLEKDGSVSSLNPARQVLARSRQAVIASGGQEQLLQPLQQLADQAEAELWCSEAILRGAKNTVLGERIAAGKRIVVVGGAHSAFSVLDYLLRYFGDALGEQQLMLFVRGPVRLYHRSVDDCRQLSPLADVSRLDRASGEVNRYSGLRGDARQVYMDVIAGREPRVSIVTGDDVTAEHVAESGCVIQATGYRSRSPVITDAGGNIVSVAHHHGNLKLTDTFNLQAAEGEPLTALYALGLGCFNATEPHFMATGEVPVGVNIYHAQDAQRIFRAIYDAPFSHQRPPSYQYAT